MTSWFGRTHRAAPGEWGIAIADQSGRLLMKHESRPAADAGLDRQAVHHRLCADRAWGNSAPGDPRGGRGYPGFDDRRMGRSWALQLDGDPSLERAEGSGPTLYDLADAKTRLTGSGSSPGVCRSRV